LPKRTIEGRKIDPVLMSLDFVVGVLVGLTGIGGGSLLAPRPILVAGTRPASAVGAAMAFAAATRAAEAWHCSPGARSG